MCIFCHSITSEMSHGSLWRSKVSPSLGQGEITKNHPFYSIHACRSTLPTQGRGSRSRDDMRMHTALANSDPKWPYTYTYACSVSRWARTQPLLYHGCKFCLIRLLHEVDKSVIKPCIYIERLITI